MDDDSMCGWLGGFAGTLIQKLEAQAATEGIEGGATGGGGGERADGKGGADATSATVASVRCTHGFYSFYGGEGSAWGWWYDALQEAAEATGLRQDCVVSFEDSTPFSWDGESRRGRARICKWLKRNDFYVPEDDHFDYMESEPWRWGNLTVGLRVAPGKREKVVRWLRSFQLTAEMLQGE